MEPSEIVSRAEAAARSGDALAQYELATMLRVGELVKQDLVQSRTWYARSAIQGYPDAQNDFASMLHNGIGGEKDGASAALWYLRAAEGGCATAQFNVAQRYLHGDYLVANDERAAFWGAEAAANNHAQGATLLGNCYRFGRGVGVDLLRAAQLYMLGARGLDPVGHGNLGDCREDLEVRALNGCGVAALITATLYAEGLGGKTDLVLAKAWLGLLADLNTSDFSIDDQNASDELSRTLDTALDSNELRQADENLQRLRLRLSESENPPHDG
jgi:TPR repeat protein